jgi:hypothetical protein
VLLLLLVTMLLLLLSSCSAALDHLLRGRSSDKHLSGRMPALLLPCASTHLRDTAVWARNNERARELQAD